MVLRTKRAELNVLLGHVHVLFRTTHSAANFRTVKFTLDLSFGCSDVNARGHSFGCSCLVNLLKVVQLRLYVVSGLFVAIIGHCLDF